MEKKKISINFTTAVTIAAIIGFLILGIIVYVIYNNLTKPTATTEGATKNQSTVTYGAPPPAEFSEKKNESNTKSEEKEKTSNENKSNSETGKSSSKQNPLAIGEWGIASKNVSSEYLDVPARVTKVTRGANAAQELKAYLENGSSIYKYEDADEGSEWAVVEYDIDLTNMEKDSTAKLDVKVTGTNSTSIQYNGYTYIVSTINMTPNKYTKGEVVSCKFAVQLPVGCTDYLIALGSSSNTQAFFRGE